MTGYRIRSSRRAFTLIEMLVIIAIIAVLLAMFMPALSSIKEFASMLMCAKRMQQLGEAQTAYCTNEDMKMPGPNWRRAHSRGWLYSDLKMDHIDDLRTGLLWPYMAGHESYRCPSDFGEDPNSVPHRPNNSRMITSYCMNGSVCGYGKRELLTGPDGWQHWNTYKATQFSGNDVIMWEADETTSQAGWWHDGANYPWEGITQRHIDKGNTVCADGHAEWMLLEEYYDMDRSGRTRLWNVPGSSNGR